MLPSLSTGLLKAKDTVRYSILRLASWTQGGLDGLRMDPENECKTASNLTWKVKECHQTDKWKHESMHGKRTETWESIFMWISLSEYNRVQWQLKIKF